MPRLHPITAFTASALALALLLPGLIEAQAPPVAAPRMRDFWHVFIAYALAWAILFGWVVAIFRRLGRLNRKLDAG